jgi:superfamily II RNA helicase
MRKFTWRRRAREARKEAEGDKEKLAAQTRGMLQDAKRFEARLAAIPCHACPERPACLKSLAATQAARRACMNALLELERVESYRPDQVRKRLMLLRSLDCITDGKLTAKGRVASRVCGYELQAAELLFQGLFDRINEDQVNVLATAIVMESRERDWYKHAPKGLVEDVFYQAGKCVDALRRREELLGIRGLRTKPLDASLTSAVWAWSREQCDFVDLFQHTDSSEGDVVRTFRMGVDLLRQIQRAVSAHPALLKKIERSIARINRGVIDAESQFLGAEPLRGSGE